MRTLLFTLISFLLAVVAHGQPDNSGYWIGMSRDSIETKRTGGGFETTSEDESGACYQMDVIGTRYCYQFIDSEVRSYSVTDLRDSREGAMKKVIKMSREWGEPIAYYADRTSVASVEQAISLADPIARVVFSPINGIAAVWVMNVEPKEPNLQDQRYTHMVKYVEVSYARDLPTRDYWR